MHFFVLLRDFMFRKIQNIILTGSLFCCTLMTVAQTGGKNVYNFLRLGYAPRQMALGNSLVSVNDGDPSLLSLNPSYLNERHNNTLVLNFTDYFTHNCYASALYAHSVPKIGSLFAEMRYVGYGTFQGTDEAGNETGLFNAGDYSMTVGWGHALPHNFYVGANLKLILSSYESYTSFGLALDVAGSYHNPDQNLSMTLLFKNIGSEIKPFTKGNYERVPFDLQFALSQRLKHVPIRYHISLHSLYRWNMNYYGEENPFLSTDAVTDSLQYPSKASQFFDNLFRHFIFGIEIEPVKYFSIQLAYNHNTHQEMKVLARRSMAGFSYGLNINISGFRVGFARQHYAVGAVPNSISFAMNFDEISKMHRDKKTRKLQRVAD